MNEPTPIERRLADGTGPLSPAALLERLDAIGIEHSTVDHPAVYTVEEAKRLRGELPGGHSKNLFLRNKKGRMWLLTCREDRAVDLKVLGERIGAGRVSFASPERLMRYLGLTPGAVTPFGLVNDHGGAVSFVLDRGLLDLEPLNFHPLDNAMTTAVSADGLMRFLAAVDHPPTLVDL